MPRKYLGAGVWVDDDGSGGHVVPVVVQVEEKKKKLSLEEAFEEVSSRFLTHLPNSELEAGDRIFFQIEQAHWFYEDFLADQKGSQLPHMHFRLFAQNMFARCALLRPLKGSYDALLANFRDYKGKIPVCGCILLDETCSKLVLVRNWNKTSWGLPKGKLNQHEKESDCAARETLEETGYDVGNALDDNPTTIEIVSDTHPVTMFVVPNVPLDFPFCPRVRKEISKIAFFKFDALPKDQWNVDKFVARLKRLLKKKKKGGQYRLPRASTPPRTPSKSSSKQSRRLAREEDEQENHEFREDALEQRPVVQRVGLLPPSSDDYSGISFGPSSVRIDRSELSKVIRDAVGQEQTRTVVVGY